MSHPRACPKCDWPKSQGPTVWKGPEFSTGPFMDSGDEWLVWQCPGCGWEYKERPLDHAHPGATQ